MDHFDPASMMDVGKILGTVKNTTCTLDPCC